MLSEKSDMPAAGPLVDRCHVVQARLLEDWHRRSIRRRTPGSYPINLAFGLLTRAQQAERLDVAQDLQVSLAHWLKQPHIAESRIRFMVYMLAQLRMSRGRYAISPSEWERIWEIRDQLYPV